MDELEASGSEERFACSGCLQLSPSTDLNLDEHCLGGAEEYRRMQERDNSASVHESAAARKEIMSRPNTFWLAVIVILVGLVVVRVINPSLMYTHNGQQDCLFGQHGTVVMDLSSGTGLGLQCSW
jgi:hypothetical protein